MQFQLGLAGHHDLILSPYLPSLWVLGIKRKGWIRWYYDELWWQWLETKKTLLSSCSSYSSCIAEYKDIS